MFMDSFNGILSIKHNHVNNYIIDIQFNNSMPAKLS